MGIDFSKADFVRDRNKFRRPDQRPQALAEGKQAINNIANMAVIDAQYFQDGNDNWKGGPENNIPGNSLLAEFGGWIASLFNHGAAKAAPADPGKTGIAVPAKTASNGSKDNAPQVKVTT